MSLIRLCVTVLVVVGVVDCQLLYLSESVGNDSNAGTQAAPLQTLGAAARLLLRGGNASLVLDGHFESCGVSLDANSTHLSLHALSAVATIGCSASATANSSGVALLRVAAVDGVEFNGLRVFNASGVELSARRVELRNVSMVDVAVVAESSEDTFGNIDSAVLRAPLAVEAVSLTATNCSFRRNSLRIVTQARGQRSPLSTFGDWRGGNATTLPVPGGGALACRCASVAIAASVFEFNSVNATALSWIDPGNTDVESIPGDHSAACGGSLLVLASGSGNGTVSGCVFRNNSISASIASGGAVAVVSSGAAFQLNVTASSFSGSALTGALLSGADLVVGGGGHGTFQLEDVTFEGAVVNGDRFNGVVRAPALMLATNVSVQFVQCAALFVACGMLCAVDVDVLNGSICDNVIVCGQASGAMFGNGRWETDADDTVCSSVALTTTRIERNRLQSRDTSSLIQQRCPKSLNNFAELLLRDAVFADNIATISDRALQPRAPLLLSATSDVPIEMSDCAFVRNVGFRQLLVLRTPSLELSATNITDNVLWSFVMDIEFVASTQRSFVVSLSIADVAVAGNTGSGFCNMFVGPHSISSITIARSAIESDERQLMLLAAVEPLEQFLLLDSRLVRQVVDIRCWVRAFSLTNSKLVGSSCLLSTSQTRALAWRSAGVHVVNSTFENCSPALGVSDADYEVSDFAVELPLPVFVNNSSFVSSLAPSAAAMFVCESGAAAIALSNTTVAASGGQRLLAASACGSLVLNNVALDGSGGIVIVGRFGALQLTDTHFVNVTALTLSAPNATAMLDNVTAVASQRTGFLFAQAREVNVSNFRFGGGGGGGMLVTPAVEFSAVGTLRITNASITAVSSSPRGTVSLNGVNRTVLHNVVVADSLARFGGGFGERALSDVECSGVVARNNLASIAGGAVFSDAPNGSFVTACVSVVNCSAAWWGGSFAGPEERLLVSHAGEPAMPGIGLRNVRVQVIDRFGQALRAAPDDPYQSEPSPPLRVARLLIFATLSCNDSTTARSLLCVIEPTGVECTGNLPLPAGVAGAECNVSVVADKTTLASDLSLVVQRCQFGYGAESPAGRSACVPCSADTVSIGGESVCAPCPPGARCCGVDRVTARPEFYVALRRHSVSAVACLPGACLGFNSTCGEQEQASAPSVSEDALNRCAPGRTGLLCAHCVDPDSVPVAPTNGVACVPCTTSQPAALVALVVGLLAFAAVVHVNAVGQSAALKILLYYTQIASAQAPAGLFLGALHLFFGFRVAAASGAFGGICVFARFSHFSLVVVRLSLPAALLCGVLLIAGGARLVVRCGRRKLAAAAAAGDGDDDAANAALSVEPPIAAPAPLFGWRRVLRTGVSIVLLTFSVCVSAALDVLHCVQLRDDESFLVSDVRQSCESTEALAWRRAAVSGLLPLAALVIVVVPCALLVLRRRQGHLQHDVAGVLFDSYRGALCRVGFESFTLLRRLLVGVVAVFVADALLRRFLFTLVNVASLLIVMLVRPYVVGAENHLDAVAQLFLVLLGTMEQTGTDVGDTLIAVGSAIPVVLIVGFMLLGQARKVRAWCIGRRQKSR
jgi:hypothetical protein